MPSTKQSNQAAVNLPAVVAIGVLSDPGIQAAVEATAENWRFVDLDKAIELVANERIDLVVLLTNLPDQFATAKITELVNAHPLVPVVALLSSYCEGELRTGAPWPGVVRVYWHKWPGQFQAFLSQWACGLPTIWNLPKTANLVDRRLVENHDPVDFPTELNIGIWNQKKTDFEFYHDLIPGSACQKIQHPEDLVAVTDSNDRFDAVIVEGNSLNESLLQRVRQVHMSLPQTPVVLILGFPRPNDYRRAKTIGVASILSKPLEKDELAVAIHCLC